MNKSIFAVCGMLALVDSSTNMVSAQPPSSRFPLGGVPIGTVVPFAGSNSKTLEAQGWMLCDGRVLNRKTYKNLFMTISSHHGKGDGVNTFNIPDYRGMFLRGVSGDTDRDPEKNARQAPQAGGSINNEVGSIQSDQLQSHNHSLHLNDPGHSHTYLDEKQPAPNTFGSDNERGLGDHQRRTDPAGTGITVTIDPAGGKETRPVNAYVNWIIRVK